VAAGVGVASTVLAGGVAAARDPDVADALSAPAERVWEQLEGAVPALRSHPKLVLGAVGLAALGGAFMWRWVPICCKAACGVMRPHGGCGSGAVGVYVCGSVAAPMRSLGNALCGVGSWDVHPM
jgi:hypothetical protein